MSSIHKLRTIASVVPGAYKMPYEEETSEQPTMAEMTNAVVRMVPLTFGDDYNHKTTFQNLRPRIDEAWKEQWPTMCEIVCSMWSSEVDKRISAATACDKITEAHVDLLQARAGKY